jgi:hypothetical protein
VTPNNSSASRGLSLDQLAELLPEIEAEAYRWREIETKAAANANDLETILRAVHRLLPSIKSPPDSPAESPTSPEGMAAVLQVMVEEPTRLWRAKEVHAVLRQRSWVSPRAKHPERGTDAAISRLLARGDIQRVERGRYRVQSVPNVREDELFHLTRIEHRHVAPDIRGE